MWQARTRGQCIFTSIYKLRHCWRRIPSTSPDQSDVLHAPPSRGTRLADEVEFPCTWKSNQHCHSQKHGYYKGRHKKDEKKKNLQRFMSTGTDVIPFTTFRCHQGLDQINLAYEPNWQNGWLKLTASIFNRHQPVCATSSGHKAELDISSPVVAKIAASTHCTNPQQVMASLSGHGW